MDEKKRREVNDMPCLRIIPVLFVLFVLLSSAVVGRVDAPDVENIAVSAVEGAEQAAASAYLAVLEAENVGADVSELLRRLDSATLYLASARMSLRIGDFDGAIGNASFCVEALDAILSEVEVLKDEATKDLSEASLMAISGSIVGVVLVACISFFGWRFFKVRYYERVLKMKPEVVKGES